MHAVAPGKTLLYGAAGTGKTYSLTTLAEAGLSLHVLFTDPGGEASLIDAIVDKGLSTNNIHWNYVAPASTDWDTLKNTAQQISAFSYEALVKMKTGIKKDKYRQFFELLALMSNFKCAHCGEEFGAVDTWGDDKAFVIDSISGLNQMAKDLTVGSKPTPHQGEWGVMMDIEERLINNLASSCKCFVVCTAHPDRYNDEATGIPTYMPAFLGNKLAPRIPRMFDNVVVSLKEGSNFLWSTARQNYIQKARDLPISDKLPPDFGQIVDAYRKRIKALGLEKEKEMT